MLNHFFLARLQRSLPPLAAGILCSCMVGFFVFAIKAQTGGLFVYPLDDSYIHLVLARTLAAHHVWGIATDHFASASSSPGWTMLLAGCDLLVGAHLLTPVFVNLLLAFAVLFAVDSILTCYAPRTPQWFRYAAAFLIVLATPLPNLAITGMEHVAQTLSVVLIVGVAVRIIAASPSSPVRPRDKWLLCLLAFCAGAVRYEAVFTIVPVVALLIWKRRFRLGLLFAASSAIAPAAFGLYFHHMSGFWLPFSVLAKAERIAFAPKSDVWGPVYLLFGLHGTLPLVPLLLLVWLIRLPSRKFWDRSQLLLLLAAVIATEHTIFAPIGWLMRYESYYVCLALVALAVALSQSLQQASRPALFVTTLRDLPRRRQVAVGLFFLTLAIFLPKLFHRAFLGSKNPVMAAVDRYDEHIQIAQLAAAEFDHDTIVVNDIGALAFYSDAHLLDVYGLGSSEPLLLKRRGKSFTPKYWEGWATSENASIAILQTDTAIGQLVPEAWTLVQRWRLPRNIVFSDYTVSFYAIKPEEAARLCSALSNFALTPSDSVGFNRCPPRSSRPGF